MGSRLSICFRYCGAFSQKYFMELITFGQSCTSSKIMKVFSGTIF